jgi:glycosyltransferase involved in cell wall biosynthesis
LTEKRPTILQIIPELDTGGAELATVEIADAVIRAGGRSIVLSRGGRMLPDLLKTGATFVPFPAKTKNPARIVWNARAIAAIVRREGVDLVHARSRAPAWSALLAARMTRRPFVTTYHGAYNEKTRIKNWYNSVMARADVVIANSQYTADLVAKRYGTPAGRLTVIHRGIDGAAFDPATIGAERVAQLRTSWGVAPEAPVILQAARLTTWKGQSVLIAAAKLLKDEGRLGKAQIVFAGDAQGRTGYAERLRSEAAAAGLADRVGLVGHVGDMPEAFGRAAAEAQIMGCPVIATRLGAPQETVLAPPAAGRDAMTGWLVTPGDARALAEAMAEALSLDEAARVALGLRARRHVLTNFTLSAMKHATLEVYDRLIGSDLAAAKG